MEKEANRISTHTVYSLDLYSCGKDFHTMWQQEKTS